MLERLAIVYASDLLPETVVAPGGINNAVLNSLPHFPSSLELEVLGVALPGAPREELRTVGDHPVYFRALCQADPLLGRRVPLNLRFMAALVRSRLGSRTFDRRPGSVILAHRAEYVPALRLTPKAIPCAPVMLLLHSTTEFSRLTLPAWKARAQGQLEGLALRLADTVACVSKVALAYYSRRFPALAHKFHHVPNAVDPQRFFPQDRSECRAALDLPPEAPIFCYHGRLEPEKGGDRLVAAFAAIQARCPEAFLLLVGDGRDRPALEAQAQALGLTRIRFAGNVAPDRIPLHLAAANISMLASAWEGMSLGVLESLACGIPVVATAVGDTPDLVRPGLSGQTVVSPEPDLLARAALETLEHSGELKASCLDIARGFSPQTNAQALARLAEELTRD